MPWPYKSTWEHSFKLKEGRFRLDTRKSFLQWGLWNTGTGCPEKWWMPHPQKGSRPRWMGLWATWLVEDAPEHCRGVQIRGPLKVPSNPKHPVALWNLWYFTWNRNKKQPWKQQTDTADPITKLFCVFEGTKAKTLKSVWQTYSWGKKKKDKQPHKDDNKNLMHEKSGGNFS